RWFLTRIGADYADRAKRFTARFAQIRVICANPRRNTLFSPFTRVRLTGAFFLPAALSFGRSDDRRASGRPARRTRGGGSDEECAATRADFGRCDRAGRL